MFETREWGPYMTVQGAFTLPPKQWYAGSGSREPEDLSLTLLSLRSSLLLSSSLTTSLSLIPIGPSTETPVCPAPTSASTFPLRSAAPPPHGKSWGGGGQKLSAGSKEGWVEKPAAQEETKEWGNGLARASEKVT